MNKAYVKGNEKVLLSYYEITNRWKRYIDEIYKRKEMFDSVLEEYSSIIKDELEPEILWDEFDFAARNIKNGKSAVHDLIFIKL